MTIQNTSLPHGNTQEPPNSNHATHDDSQLSVATFNLFNYVAPPYACYDFDRIYTSEQWHKKQSWISTYLNNHRPDVIGFQEVFSPDALASLVNDCGYPYFHVIDAPIVEHDYVYRHPVVGIASRYPIVEVEAVEHDTNMVAALGLASTFTFNRIPLRATIELPHIGPTDCYVIHLKSQRSVVELEEQASNSKNYASQVAQAQAIGNWGASLQRGSEAALLLHAIIARRQQKRFPVMLMGDFNSELFSGVLSHLVQSPSRRNSHLVDHDAVAQFQLKDSWELFNMVNEQHTPRPPTHYYGPVGSVLDYILLSNEFDASHQNSLFEVGNYQSFDKHLIDPTYAIDSESTDHGIVQLTLKLRN